MFDKNAWARAYNQKPEVKQKNRERARRYRNSHLEKCRADARIWRARHPELKPIIAIESKIRNKENNFMAKVRALMRYSNPAGAIICNHCGIQDIDILCLDHINGEGGRHRKAINIHGSRFYTWLDQHNYPRGLQVLCWNCNRKKELCT